MGGTETEVIVHLSCSRRPGSFTFRTDDEFILDYESFDNAFPVIPRDQFDSFNLRPPFGMLILGVTFTALGLAVLVYEACTRKPSRPPHLAAASRIGTISVGLTGVS